MRGQESGSEHEREAERSAAPTTPPPSFGQPSPPVQRTAPSGDDQPYDQSRDPSAWPEQAPGAAQPWTVPDDGAPYDWYADPDDEAQAPRPSQPPQSFQPPQPPASRPGVPQPGAPAPPGRSGPPWAGPATPQSPQNAQNAQSAQGGGSGAPPWAAAPQPPQEAPRDPSSPPWAPQAGAAGTSAPSPSGPAWAAPPAPEQPGGPGGGSPVPLTTAPIVPGAPPWQPPPAFTAAAAGMQVWPSTEPGAHDGPRWPAATGEPVWTEHDDAAGRPGGPGGVAVRPPGGDGPGGDPAAEAGSGGAAAAERPAGPTGPGQDAPAGGTVPPRVPDQDQAAAEAAAPGHPGAAPGSPGAVPAASAVPDATPEAASQAPAGQSPPGAPHPAREGSAASERSEASPLPPGPLPPGPAPAGEAAPPGGIPELPPLFPPIPAAQTAQPPVPMQAVAQERGPFTPPSAMVPVQPAPQAAPSAARRNRVVILAAAAVVLAAGVGTGVVLVQRSSDDPKPPAVAQPDPTAGDTGPTDPPAAAEEPQLTDAQVINSEKTDPGKMTVTDAFTKKITVGSATFVRVKTDVAKQCQEAAAGKFASALSNRDCRQVLRATYVDKKRKYAVTTGIAVLPDRASAIAADQEKNLGTNLWFRGLSGAAGSGAERVSIAGGYASGMVWGRYIVFSYATFSDGHTPTAKEKVLGRVSGAFRDATAKAVEKRAVAGQAGQTGGASVTD
ncbi:hypothetical protein AB0D67_28200 [Streptosporangium sp. NPDC048047]|uniref:hypothetical protein n=1 Tax=Streptosporangium sp. NPDC048047 TaxID=3155748 RepID=UPI003428788D